MKKVIIALVCVLLLFPTVSSAKDYDSVAQEWQTTLEKVAEGSDVSFLCTYVDSEELLMLFQVYPGIENVKEKCASDASFASSWETVVQSTVQMDGILQKDAKSGGIHSMALLVSTPEPVDSLEALLLSGYDVLAASRDGNLIYNAAE
ncbi:MAG: hypothetical protein SOY94_01200 [Candidatus Limiplasma sp.]|nr:hypothetical protein [Candidatus Limiplasma sp.]